MAFTPFRIAEPDEPHLSIALEPVYNVLNSLSLLNVVERMPALDPWVMQTAESLTPPQRRINRLLFEALGDMLLLDPAPDDVSAYLDALAARPADQLRDQVLRRFRDHAPDELLADRQLYLAQVERLSPNEPVDPALHAEALALLNDPPALRDLAVSHLRWLWETALAAEWERQAPHLQRHVATLQQFAPHGATIVEKLQTYIGHELAGDPSAYAGGARRIIYVPSAHTGRYVTRLSAGGTLRVFFHAGRNFPVLLRSTPVERAELLQRLSGLADDTRLDILELFARRDTLSAQEIMAALDLSQSSTSRHLKALSIFLQERRGNGASKVYSLVPAQLDLTFQALRQSFGAQEGSAGPSTLSTAAYPPELRRFLDDQERITTWPARQKDQLTILEYLASRFEPGRFYTEKEVNAIITRYHSFGDYARLRRELYNFGLLRRERDGSRYWLAEQR